MNSRVISLFDYHKQEIPADLRVWGIPNEVIERELNALTVEYAKKREVTDGIQEGDSVFCTCVTCEDVTWNGRTILLYPGRNLLGAKMAEQEILGYKVGEQVSISIHDLTMIVEIKKVRRLIISEVSDSFVASLGLEGVHSVEDFYCWYHRMHDMEYKTKASYRIIHYWLTATADGSTYEIDEEEKKCWCIERGKVFFEGMLAAGYDLRIPTEGFDFLTTEEAIEKAAKEQEGNFIPYLVIKALCEQDGYVVTEEMYEKMLQEESKKQGMSLEEARNRSAMSFYEEISYKEHLFTTLSKEAMKILTMAV